MNKTIEELLDELNDRPVPDETLTKAWWDLETGAEAAWNKARALPKSEAGHKERFDRLFEAAVKPNK